MYITRHLTIEFYFVRSPNFFIFFSLFDQAQDYSVRISGEVIPRNPRAYQEFFDELLRKNKMLKIPNDPATAQLSNEGVVRVTVLYDIDETMKFMQSNILSTRSYQASHISYSARDVTTTMSVEEQKKGYLFNGKKGKPTCNTWFKTMLGCTCIVLFFCFLIFLGSHCHNHELVFLNIVAARYPVLT